MKLEEYYTIGELLQINEESARNEFKPKFGNGAERNSNNNDKAVKEIIKNASELEKGVKRDDTPVKPRVEFPDYNKTTLDVNFEYEPGKEWKDRVEAQAEGYPSVQNKEKNGYDQSLGFDGNENFYKARKEMSKDRNDLDTIERESGLKARIKKDEIDYSNKTAFNESIFNKGSQYKTNSVYELAEKNGVKLSGEKDNGDGTFTFTVIMPGDTDDGYQEKVKSLIKDIRSMYDGKYIKCQNDINHYYITVTNQNSLNEAKQIKRLKFKNTIFLSESHLLSKVPEDYRVDENRFYMQDKTGTDYLIECKADPFGYIHMQVVNKFNKQVINEELEKMKRLAGYRYSDGNKKVDTGKMETMSESISNFREKLNN
jgi:hypothetical protein